MDIMAITTELQNVFRKYEEEVNASLSEARRDVLSAKAENMSNPILEESDYIRVDNTVETLFVVTKLHDLFEQVNETIFDLQSEILDRGIDNAHKTEA